MTGRATLPSLLLGGLLVAGCAGEQTADQAPGAPAAEMEAASDLSCYLSDATMEEAQQRPSPLRSVELELGDGEGLLCYGAPSARGREVMGSLVPHGQPWRMGANEPTTLHLDTSANVGGVLLQPGSYSLYAIPGENEWTVHVSSSWERWGIPIDESVRSSDVGSFTVPAESTDQMVEMLTYRWEPSGETGGELVMEWENTRIRFPVTAAG